MATRRQMKAESGLECTWCKFPVDKTIPCKVVKMIPTAQRNTYECPECHTHTTCG